MTVEKCMSQSLVYERAATRIQILVNTLLARKKRDEEDSEEYERDADLSYPLVIKDLRKLQESYQKESDRLWKMAEDKTEFYDWAFEKLANAIIIKAVEDYEMAICGGRDENEITLIEQFAEKCDKGEIPYTNLEVKVLLERVQEKQKEFAEIAKANAKHIIEETKQARAKKIEFNRHNTHKCPLCGGVLYDDTQCGVHRIACSGCYLFEPVRVDKRKRN